MKVETYVIPKIKDGSIYCYDFEIVLTYDNGTIIRIGHYIVYKNDYIIGNIDDSSLDDVKLSKKIKRIVLAGGLNEIVGSKTTLSITFWDKISLFPLTCEGAFNRVHKLVQDGKYIIMTDEEFWDELDAGTATDNYGADVEVYDGIYGSDEFDNEAYVYSDLDNTLLKKSKRY